MVVRTRIYSQRAKEKALREYSQDWEWNKELSRAIHKPTGMEVYLSYSGRMGIVAFYKLVYGKIWKVGEGCKNDREFFKRIKKITKQFTTLEQAGYFPELTEEEKRARGREITRQYKEEIRQSVERFNKFYAVHGEEYEIWRRIKGLEKQIARAEDRRDEKLVKIKQEEKRRLEEEFKKAQAATAARLKASGQNQGR